MEIKEFSEKFIKSHKQAWDFPDSLGMMTQLGVIPSASPKQ